MAQDSYENTLVHELWTLPLSSYKIRLSIQTAAAADCRKLSSPQMHWAAKHTCHWASVSPAIKYFSFSQACCQC